MKMLKLSSLLAILLVGPLFGAGNWPAGCDAAKMLAAKAGKDLLVDFTGPDWCECCIKAAQAPVTPKHDAVPAKKIRKAAKPVAKPGDGKTAGKPLARKEAPKPAPQAPPRKAESRPVKSKRVAKLSEAQLKKALDEARRDLAKIKTAHDSSRKGWEKVQSSLKDLRTQVLAKERELATLRKDLAGEEKKAGTFKMQHDRAHAAESTAKSALEALEKELERRNMIAKLEAEAAALQRKAEELRKQAEKLRN